MLFYLDCFFIILGIISVIVWQQHEERRAKKWFDQQAREREEKERKAS